MNAECCPRLRTHGEHSPYCEVGWVQVRRDVIEAFYAERSALEARLAAVEALCVPHDHGHDLPIDPGSCFRCEVRAAARGDQPAVITCATLHSVTTDGRPRFETGLIPVDESLDTWEGNRD